MLLSSATILCLLVLAQSATIHQRNIPVEVRYDEPVDINSIRNLNEKIQLSPAELREASQNVKEELEENSDELASRIEEKRINAVKNLEEKVQLSPDELDQALKHLPAQEEETLTAEESAPLKKLGELPQVEDVEQITKEPYSLNVQSILQQAEDVISNGIKKLRLSFKPNGNEQGLNPQQWEDLEKAVNEYIEKEKAKLQLKQDQSTSPPPNQSFFQNLASGFQTVANNFVQNLQNLAGQAGNTNSTNQGDEQQGPLQGFINYFQGGVNNIVSTISSLGSQGPTTSNTVLGDTGTGSTTQAPGLISNLVSNVQQFFGQIQGSLQPGGSTGTQGDTGVNNTVSRPQGPVQVIQSIGSTISNLIQGPRPPNTSGDEGTATTQPSNIIQSIGSAIQNLNPFRPPAPGGGETTQNPIQAGISGVQSIGSQIQQLLPGQGSTTEASKKPEDETPASQNNQVTEKEPAQKDVTADGGKETIKEENNQGQGTQEVPKEGEKQDSPKEEEIKQEVSQENVKEEENEQEQVQEEIKQEEIKQEEEVNQEVPKEDNEENIEQVKEGQQEANQEEVKEENVQTEEEQENKQEEGSQEEAKEQETPQEELKEENVKKQEVEHKEELLVTAE